jgi:multiple antibiotic resistance protein
MLTTLGAALSVAVLSLFPIVNPIGNLPVFAALTEDATRDFRQRQAFLASLYVAIVLLVSAVAGRPILHGLGISLGALEVAGGVVVAHTAMRMVVGDAQRLAPTDPTEGQPGAASNIAFVPMTIPLLSGPGAIGAAIALTTRAKGSEAMIGIAIGIVVLTIIVLTVLLFGDRLLVRLGRGGTDAMTRLFGFLTLAIAVELVTHGVLALAPALRS